jgi:hypothetical protein
MRVFATARTSCASSSPNTITTRVRQDGLRTLFAAAFWSGSSFRLRSGAARAPAAGVLDAFEFHRVCDDMGFGLVSSLIFRYLDVRAGPLPTPHVPTPHHSPSLPITPHSRLATRHSSPMVCWHARWQPDGSGSISYKELMVVLHADGAPLSPSMQKQIKELVLSLETKRDPSKPAVETKGWVLNG